MSIYGNSVGGGGIALNFDVVDGTTAPGNPSENTIWVNTDTPITGWFFSAQDPATNYDTKNLLTSATMASGLLKDGSADTSYDASYTEDFIPIKDGKIYTYSFSARYENDSTGGTISVSTLTKMIITEYCIGNNTNESYTYYNDVVVVDTRISGQTVPTYKTFSGTYTPSSSQVKAVRISSTNNYYYASSTSVPLRFIEKNDTSWVDNIAWIITGTNSSINFNVTKNKSKNIEIHPIICKQYISGEWVNVEAKSYQNGEWVDWIVYLYESSDEFTAVTGGWQARAWKLKSGYTAKAPTLTKNDDCMTAVVNTSNTSGVVEIVNDIDLTPYSTIYLEYSGSGLDSSYYGMLGVADREATYYKAEALAIVNVVYDDGATSHAVAQLDVSSINQAVDVFVGLHITSSASGKNTINIHKVWLE